MKGKKGVHNFVSAPGEKRRQSHMDKNTKTRRHKGNVRVSENAKEIERATESEREREPGL